MTINNDLLRLRDAYFELNNNISKDKVISHLPSSFRIKITSDSLKLHSSVASTPRSDLKRAIHELAIETLDQESVDNINNFFGSFYRCAGVKNTGDCNWSEHHYKDIDRMDVFFQAIGQVFQRVEERPSTLAQIMQEFTARVSNLLHIRPILPEKQLVDAIIGLLDSDLSQAVQALNLLSEEHKTRLSSHFNIYKNNPQYGSVSEPDIFEKKGSAKFKAEVIADFLLCNPDILNSQDMQKTVKKIFCDWFDSQYIEASKRLGLPCPSSQEEECLGKFIYNMEKGLDERAQRYFSLLSNSLQQQMTDFCKKRLGNSFSFSTALDDSRAKEGKISALVYFIRNETITGKNELLNNMRMLNVWSDTVRRISYSSNSKVGRAVENKDVNQWGIYPYDCTRLILSSGKYINANLVFDKFILTQSPVTPECKTDSPCNTVDVFYEMIAEKRPSSIVMLNGETGSDFLTYYPQEINQTKSYGGYTIKLLDKTIHSLPDSLGVMKEAITERKLLITDAKGQCREVAHIKAENWKDFTKGEENLILKVAQLVKKYEHPDKPVVIHCRAGVGRTGVLAVVLHHYDEACKGRSVDVIDTVKTIRSPERGRCPYMLQGDHQILSAHKALLNLKPYP